MYLNNQSSGKQIIKINCFQIIRIKYCQKGFADVVPTFDSKAVTERLRLTAARTEKNESGGSLTAARTEKNESGGFLARRLGDPVDLSRRLLEVGDIEPNPGPKWPCGFCNKEVKNTGWSIKCVDCLQYIHRECLGWSVREIKSYDGYRWHCGCDHLKSNTADPNPIRPRTKEGLKIIQLNVNGWRGKGDVVKKASVRYASGHSSPSRNETDREGQSSEQQRLGCI